MSTIAIKIAATINRQPTMLVVDVSKPWKTVAEVTTYAKEKGAKTVIVVGTGANGAVLYTGSGAAMRGMKVIIPVDGMSGDTTYIEQYVAWHLVNAPVIGTAFTLTTIDQVTF